MHPLPQDAPGLTEVQAEAFHCQLESNFKGHPAIKMQEFNELTRRGEAAPIEHAMGWPPGCTQEGSAILHEKLRETTPRTMTVLQHVMNTHQSKWNGHRALMTIVK